MPTHRWSPAGLSKDLGTMAHGPVVLARSPGIAAGLRCIFGYPTGLKLLLVVQAVDVQAEAAGRQSEHDAPAERSSEVSVVATVNNRTGPMIPADRGSSWGNDHFELEQELWIDELPLDNRLILTTSWPQVGLAETSVTLILDDLSGLADRAIALI